MSGGDLYPPANCCCRNCSFRNSSSYPGFYGGGGPQEFRLTHEMGRDIYGLICTLGTFIEDLRVTLGIEIKAVDKLGKPVVVNSASWEPPVHGVNFDLPVGNDQPLCSGEKHHDSHGLDVADAVHGDGDREGT